MTAVRHPTRLPPRTALHVGFAGKLYPAWIERWTRRVFTAAGPAAKSAAVVIHVGAPKFTKAHNRLWAKLDRWGYANLSAKKRSPDDDRDHQQASA